MHQQILHYTLPMASAGDEQAFSKLKQPMINKVPWQARTPLQQLDLKEFKSDFVNKETRQCA